MRLGIGHWVGKGGEVICAVAATKEFTCGFRSPLNLGCPFYDDIFRGCVMSFAFLL